MMSRRWHDESLPWNGKTEAIAAWAGLGEGQICKVATSLLKAVKKREIKGDISEIRLKRNDFKIPIVFPTFWFESLFNFLFSLCSPLLAGRLEAYSTAKSQLFHEKLRDNSRQALHNLHKHSDFSTSASKTLCFLSNSHQMSEQRYEKCLPPSMGSYIHELRRQTLTGLAWSW